MAFWYILNTSFFLVNLQVSYCNLRYLWEELGDFSVFWCSGIWNAKAHIWNSLFGPYSKLYASLLKEGGKSLEKYFFQLCILSVNLSWLICIYDPDVSIAGPNRTEEEAIWGKLLFSRGQPYPLVQWARSGHTSCHGNLVFQRNLNEEFIFIPKINLKTCHTISMWCAVWVADCKEETSTFKVFFLSESFTLVSAIVVISSFITSHQCSEFLHQLWTLFLFIHQSGKS